MVVKANQPELLAAIAELFAAPPPPLAADYAETYAATEQGHGRLERRTLERSAALNACLDWPGAGQVLRRTYRAVELRTGKVSEEVTDGITSLAPRDASARALEALWRGHWTIEIVQAQVTKAGVLAARAGRDDVADLDLVVGDHDPVNEQLDQLPLSLERGAG